MKKLIFSLIGLFYFTNFSNSQNIVGLWQSGSAEITAAYLDTYQFFPDGTFRFNTNQYDELRRIISLGGNYKLEGDRIRFTVKYSIEVIGGTFSRTEIGTGSDSWSIENGVIKNFPIQKPKEDIASFSFNESQNILLIDKRKFFKIHDDPNDFL
jgi:hypothetical protein